MPAPPPPHLAGDLAVPTPRDRCHFCHQIRAEVEKHTELVRLFRRWQCRDRVDCYKAWRP